MNDLFKKLNTLVKASMNDVLGDVTRLDLRKKLGPEIDHEVTNLRQRVNDALDYETELAQRVEALNTERNALDSAADEALQAGQDDQARVLIGRLQRLDQQIAMAEADLREHRLVTQELILRVNELDAAIADARHAESQEAAEETTEASPSPVQQASEQAGQVLSDALKEIRERVQQMNDTIDAREDLQPSAEEQASQVAAQKAVDDDIAARRDRLSRRDPKS